MLKIPRWKAILVAIVCLLAVLVALPNVVGKYMPSWLPHKTVNLGLDLQGGSHLLLEVQTDVAMRERLEGLVDLARAELRKAGIGYVGLGVAGGGITFTLRDPMAMDKAISLTKKLEAGLIVNSSEGGGIRAEFSEVSTQERISHMVDESIEIVRRRVDELGTREPSIQREGSNRIVVQVPGLQDPRQLKEILSQTAKLYFRFVDETAVEGSVAPIGSEWLPFTEQPGRKLAIKRKVIVSGENLVDAQATFQNGEPVVSFKFDGVGARKFGDATRQNVGKLFAIILDDKIISAPVINEPIPGGSGVISGRFTVEGANNLAVLLRAGALPAPLTVLEERTVGPGLGEDSIRAGAIASLVGLGLVVVFVFLTYGFFGMLANLSLLLNLSMIFALLSILQATLTLPGIAGIVLTIGMAVDANILIFERIREEARLGRPLVSAIDAGYSHALSAIIDSNLTTLIAAFLLFSFGTGPIRGFAVTLTIGIITSLFSAITVTRVMIATWLKRARPQKLPI